MNDKYSKFKTHEILVLVLSRESIDKDVINLVQHIAQQPDLDWDKFTGTVINNRLNGVVYQNILKNNIKEIPKKVVLCLKLLFLSQIERNKYHQFEITELSNAFEKENIKYAFLKGAVLNTLYYKEGERISNDTDIMIPISDINNASKIMKKLGYVQGESKGDEIVEYYVAAEPPVRCGESHLSRQAEPPCCYSV